MKYALYLVYVFNAGTPEAYSHEWAIAGNMTLEECTAAALAQEPTPITMMGGRYECDIDHAPETW